MLSVKAAQGELDLCVVEGREFVINATGHNFTNESFLRRQTCLYQ